MVNESACIHSHLNTTLYSREVVNIMHYCRGTQAERIKTHTAGGSGRFCAVLTAFVPLSVKGTVIDL